MNFPTTHSAWMWLYFGTFGSMGTVLFILVVWNWMKVHSLAKGLLRSIAIWNVIGYMFLFLGAWFGYGIGGPPGNLLSPDITVHNLNFATGTATFSIFASVPGWICLLVGQRKMVKLAQQEQKDKK